MGKVEMIWGQLNTKVRTNKSEYEEKCGVMSSKTIFSASCDISDVR